MSKIISLPENIVSKIAAGEVVERPAFAVKELVDNAIDAGATVIEVSIEEAGLRRISIQDNGDGMSEADVKLSVLPHTTSKLTNEDDLRSIKTLGFRGEALASIAAISTLTIRTRVKDQPGGTEMIVHQGDVHHTSPIGTPPGTIVTVDNLFFNVPARKKFLKSEKTEFRLICDIVSQFALAYPNIHFILKHNKKLVLDLPAKNDRADRIKILLGSTIFNNLIPINFEEGYIHITGFIGKPQSATKQNQKQFIFINQRYVNDKMIALSVREAFGTLLPASSTPVFILVITLPPETIDVNIHPRKEQVSFINSNSIFSAIKQATTESLNEHNLTFKLSKFKVENSARIGETTSFAGVLLKESVLPWDRDKSIVFTPSKKIFQIYQTYIFSPTEEGLFFIDQHAAHERIIYEKLAASFESKKKTKESYLLPHPLSLDLSFSDLQLFKEYDESFKDIGFEIEEFQGTHLLIRAVPLIFKGRSTEKIMRELLSDFENGKSQSLDSRSQRMLAFLSCRAAVKAGDVLTPGQMKDILSQLEESPHNTTCPHGRPTKLFLSLTQLHSSFKR